MPTRISLEKIEEAIHRSKPEEQRRFLTRLPRILGIDEENWTWLKMSEPSFDFWDNPYDDRYNDL